MTEIKKNCCSMVSETVLQNGVNVVIPNGISAGYTDVDAETKRFNMFCDKGYFPQPNPKMFVGALDSNGKFYRFTIQGEAKNK